MTSTLALAAALAVAAPDHEPAPASPPPPTVTQAPASSAPPPVADRRRDNSVAGKALLGTGVSLLGIGGLSLVAVALPSAIVKRVALNRARRDPVIGASSREARYSRARIADDVMEGAFWTGAACLAVGIPLTIAGAVIHARARPEVASRVNVDGSGLTLRF